MTSTQALELLTLESVINGMAQAGSLPIGGIVICSEIPTRDIALKEPDAEGKQKTLEEASSTLAAAGRAQRFPEQEIVLWTGDAENDLTILRDLVSHEPDLAKLGDKVNPLVDAIGKRLTGLPLSERKYLAPGWIFHELARHHMMLIQGQDLNQVVLPSLERQMSVQLSHGVGAELQSVRGKLEAAMSQNQKDIQLLQETRGSQSVINEEMHAQIADISERQQRLELMMKQMMERLEQMSSTRVVESTPEAATATSIPPTAVANSFRTPGQTS